MEKYIIVNMSNQFSVVVNTHSSIRDLWGLFFSQLEKHLLIRSVGSPISIKTTYVFTDDAEGLPTEYQGVLYDKEAMFRTQYLECLKSVDEEFILYLNEDYILYDDVNLEKLAEYLKILKDNPELAFIRFTRGPNITEKNLTSDLFYLSHEQPFFYSQTAAIWRKSVLQRVHEIGPDTHIGARGMTEGHFEVGANEVCRELNLRGVVAYNGEPLRGGHHYDSCIFPYIASALIRGKWNLKEYPKELLPLLQEHKINPQKRSWV